MYLRAAEKHSQSRYKARAYDNRPINRFYVCRSVVWNGLQYAYMQLHWKCGPSAGRPRSAFYPSVRILTNRTGRQTDQPRTARWFVIRISYCIVCLSAALNACNRKVIMRCPNVTVFMIYPFCCRVVLCRTMSYSVASQSHCARASKYHFVLES